MDFSLGISEPLGKCQAGLQKRSRCGKMSLYISRGEAIKVHGDVELQIQAPPNPRDKSPVPKYMAG
jgi:hypothetical protein